MKKQNIIKLNVDSFNRINTMVTETDQKKLKRSTILEFNGYNVITEAEPEEAPVPAEVEAPAEQPEEVPTPEEGGVVDTGVEEPIVPMGQETAVEVDITDMVTASQDIKDVVDRTLEKLESAIELMNNVLTQTEELKGNTESGFNNLNTELEKRVPTKVERQEMISYQGAPYTEKITDIFKQNEDGSVDVVMPKKPESTPENPQYSDTEIKQSFSQAGGQNLRWRY